ncbi:hypothetical protein TNCV_3520751 [Trichonephila clavipes]|nr:hypothetical protein TNCV_3520751 [Trichonephila clavipes]
MTATQLAREISADSGTSFSRYSVYRGLIETKLIPREQCDLHPTRSRSQETPPQKFFSNVRLEKLNTVVKKDTSAIGNYILVDFNQVNNLLRSAKCQYCEKQTLKLELGAKLGFSYNLKLLCSNCDENKTVVNTSLKSVQTSHDVNLRITQAFSHIGKGYSAIEKFCMVMNIDPFFINYIWEVCETAG